MVLMKELKKLKKYAEKVSVGSHHHQSNVSKGCGSFFQTSVNANQVFALRFNKSTQVNEYNGLSLEDEAKIDQNLVENRWIREVPVPGLRCRLDDYIHCNIKGFIY